MSGRENIQSRFIEMFGNPVTNTKSWPTKALSEVAPESPSTNKTTGLVWVLNLDMVESQSGRVIEKVYDNEENLNSVAPFDDGNVLFSKLRPYLNKVVIPNGEGYATTELVPLRPDTSIVRKEFLACLLRSNDFVNYADAIATGTKMPRMPMTALRDFKCIIPPISFQDEFIKVSQQADKSKFIGFKSRFIEMFGQISDTTPRYEVKRLSDCCSYISDGSHFSPAEDSSGSYPMLSVKDMTENGFVYSDCKYISKKDFDVLVSNGCQPHLNDVLVAKDGSYFKYSFVVTEDKEQAILSSIAILRPKTEVLDPRYLAYYMLTDAVIQLVEKNYLTGTAIRRVILKGFKEIPTIIPPMELQKSFVSVLGQADKSKYLN